MVKLNEDQIKAQTKPLDDQIQALKVKLATYPDPSHYMVDCFALETAQKYGAMEVYDHGLVLH
jgi:hypothetical protein